MVYAILFGASGAGRFAKLINMMLHATGCLALCRFVSALIDHLSVNLDCFRTVSHSRLGNPHHPGDGLRLRWQSNCELPIEDVDVDGLWCRS